MERLAKFLARCGVASRRKAEEFILGKKVKVNGTVVSELGTKIEPEKDIVEVGGKRIGESQKVYYLLNKPKGYMVTVSDPFAKKTVLDILPKDERIFPVGRLDKDTTGLLILTNDGDLAFRLTHPRFEKEKQYEVTTNKELGPKEAARLEKGILLDGKKTAKSKIEYFKKDGNSFIYSITIREGRNRQVRDMFLVVGSPVRELKRIRLDFLTLGSLKEGQFRKLAKNEVERLLS